MKKIINRRVYSAIGDVLALLICAFASAFVEAEKGSLYVCLKQKDEIRFISNCCHWISRLPTG